MLSAVASAAEINELIAFDHFIEPIGNRGSHHLIAAMRATYINGHLDKAAKPYSADDLIPWSETSHARTTGTFTSRQQLLSALNSR